MANSHEFTSKTKHLIRVKYVDEPENEFQIETSDIEHKPLVPKIQKPLQGDSESQLIELKNLKYEKEIFLKATLQLLDLKESFESFTLTSSSGNGGTTSKAKRHVAHKQAQQALNSKQPSSQHLFPLNHLKPLSNNQNSYDIIRYGTLKKASRANSALGLSSTLTWKTKYVAVRHGIFTYDDAPLKDAPTSHGTSWNGDNNSVASSTGGQHHNHTSRSIILTSDTITVHMHNNANVTHGASSRQVKQANNEYVFEITCQTTGVKRLWMTYSMSDCLEWISAITSACISSNFCNKDEYSMNASVNSALSVSNSSTEGGLAVSALMSAVAFDNEGSLLGTVDSSSAGHHHKKHFPQFFSSGATRDDAIHSLASSSMDTSERDGGGGVHEHILSKNIPHSQSFTQGASSHIHHHHGGHHHGHHGHGHGHGHMHTIQQSSMAGAAAPYAGDITRYLNLRNKVSKIETEAEYKDLVKTLIAKNVVITIPIFYIKNKTQAANFNLTSQDGNAHQKLHSTPAAVPRSQMWLDYARDVVVVNSETVRGGVDSVLGALVRHLMGKTEELFSVLDLIEEQEKEAIRQREAVQACVGGIHGVEHYLSSTKEAGLHVPLLHPHHATDNIHSDNQGHLNNHPGIALSIAATASGLLPPKITTTASPSTSAHAQYDYEAIFSESTMVATARDLLMLCNRTQSGGDTYYTIDSLLCTSDGHNNMVNNGMKLCILTPLSCNTDPIDITIDVVHCARIGDVTPAQSVSASAATSRIGSPNARTPAHGTHGGLTRKSSMVTRNKSSLYNKAYGSQNNSDSDNIRSGKEDEYQQLLSDPSPLSDGISTTYDDRHGRSGYLNSTAPHSASEQHAAHQSRIAALHHNTEQNAHVKHSQEAKNLANKLNTYTTHHHIIVEHPFDSSDASPVMSPPTNTNHQSTNSMYLTPDSSCRTPMDFMTLNSASAQQVLHDRPLSTASVQLQGMAILESQLSPALDNIALPSPGSVSSEHSTSNSVTSPYINSTFAHSTIHGALTIHGHGSGSGSGHHHKQAYTQPLPSLYQASVLNNNYTANSKYSKERGGLKSKDDSFLPHGAISRRGVVRRASKNNIEIDPSISKKVNIGSGRQVPNSASVSNGGSANSSAEKKRQTPQNVASNRSSPGGDYSRLPSESDSARYVDVDEGNNGTGTIASSTTHRKPQLDFREVLQEEENKSTAAEHQRQNATGSVSQNTLHPSMQQHGVFSPSTAQSGVTTQLSSNYTNEQIHLHNSLYSTNYVYSEEDMHTVPGQVYTGNRGGHDDQSVVSELTMDTTLRNAGNNFSNNSLHNPLASPEHPSLKAYNHYTRSSPPLPITLSDPLVLPSQNKDYVSHSYDDAKTLMQISRYANEDQEDNGMQSNGMNSANESGREGGGGTNPNTPSTIKHKHKTKNIFKFISKKLTPHKQLGLYNPNGPEYNMHSFSNNDILSPTNEKRRNSDTAAMTMSSATLGNGGGGGGTSSVGSTSGKYFPSHLFGSSASNTIQSQQQQQQQQMMQNNHGIQSNSTIDYFADLPDVSQTLGRSEQPHGGSIIPPHTMFSSPQPHGTTQRIPNTATSNTSHGNSALHTDQITSTQLNPLGFRITVRAESKYRICTSDPQGYDDEDIWAIVSGVFTQSFYLIPQCNGRLVMSERVVTIKIDPNLSAAIVPPADMINPWES